MLQLQHEDATDWLGALFAWPVWKPPSCARDFRFEPRKGDWGKRQNRDRRQRGREVTDMLLWQEVAMLDRLERGGDEPLTQETVDEVSSRSQHGSTARRGGTEVHGG